MSLLTARDVNDRATGDDQHRHSVGQHKSKSEFLHDHYETTKGALAMQ